MARQAVKNAKTYVASECPLAGMHIVQGMRKLDPATSVEEAPHPIQLFARAYGLAP